MNLKKIGLIILGLFVLVVGLSSLGIFYLTRGLDAGEAVSIENVDFLSLEDGIYEGSYQYKRWDNKLKLTIENQSITSIELLDDVLFEDENVRQTLIERVIDEQSLDVDVVTGATVTSKAYLKAMENALKSKMK